MLLGWTLITTPPHQERGIQLLEASFDSARVTPTVDISLPQTYVIAATIGRYRSQKKEYAAANKFTQIGLELSKLHGPNNDSEKRDTTGGDICIQMQLGTMFDYFPASTDAAENAISSMIRHAQTLLKIPDDISVNDKALSAFPGAGNDPFVHCMLSIFYLSFYYHVDVAAIAAQNYEMARRGWPALDTTAEFVRKYDMIDTKDHPCIRRRIKLGVVSAVLTEGHSNSESFGGMLSRLDRNIFDVTYILLVEQSDPRMASFTQTHSSDKRHVFPKLAEDINNGAWTTRIGKDIESMEFDIIFHFELGMSSWARRIGMQRLAPVQLNSIGHPITSGAPPSVVQYYISWGAAELPLETSQTHYTEELKLLPSDIVYQYYERRVLPGNISRMDQQPYGHLTRADFGLPKDKNMYLCMQKPFKFQPEFDVMLCGVLKNDPSGMIVLHRETNPANQIVFENRLKGNGCDMSRVTFLDQQPHHRLLALYRESTVILDSYPAGGDTTTREVLEMGKPMVTLPARLLGGRWSLAYMNTIGLKQSTKDALIASTPEEYINLAVKLATDNAFREAVEADIRQCVPNLFHREDAVAAWQKMLLEISPYQQCNGRNDEL